MCDTLCVLLSSAIQSGDLHVSLRFPGFYCRVRARACVCIVQRGCMCKHLIAVVAPFHNTVNTQGRGVQGVWLKIGLKSSGAELSVGRGGEKGGSQDSLGSHQLQWLQIQIRKHMKIQIQSGPGGKWFSEFPQAPSTFVLQSWYPMERLGIGMNKCKSYFLLPACKNLC